jgi:hypothetical protein
MVRRVTEENEVLHWLAGGGVSSRNRDKLVSRDTRIRTGEYMPQHTCGRCNGIKPPHEIISHDTCRNIKEVSTW